MERAQSSKEAEQAGSSSVFLVEETRVEPLCISPHLYGEEFTLSVGV